MALFYKGILYFFLLFVDQNLNILQTDVIRVLQTYKDVNSVHY